MSYQEDALKILNEFFSRLDKKEAAEMLLISKKWGVVSTKLEDLIKELSEKEDLSKDKLFKLDLYKEFLIESRTQVAKFTLDAAGIISDNQRIFAQAGIEMTSEQISLLRVSFGRLPIDAVNNMIGISSEGTKLYDLLKKSYPDAVDRLTNTLIQSTALGRNPLDTARLMKEDMNWNLRRARVIARTEQLQILRETSRLQMIKSGVVTEWERIEQPDACDECQALNGKRYSLDTVFDTHPNCRGANIPIGN